VADEAGQGATIMDDAQLQKYLQDHLAGADAALTIASRLERRHTGTQIAAVMGRLAADIRRERAVVSAVLERVDAPVDPIRRAIGIVGSIGRLAASLPFMPEPTLLEDLEALAVGVWGKRLLWGALGRVQESEGGLDGVDLDELATMAENQEREILALRQDAIVEVLDLAA
jgi:hypothetical protein